MNEERKKILDMVASGKISPEQGAALLRLVSAPEEQEAELSEQSGPVGTQEPTSPAQVASAATPDGSSAAVPAPTDRTASRFGPLWLYPLGAGLTLLLVGGTVVTSMHQQQRVNAWTWLCGWIPLFLGTLVVTLAVWARTAHWIHLRIRDHGHRVALSFPLPLGLAAAAVRVARPFVPQLRDTAVDEAILALRDGLQGNEDITIEVHDDDEGESVQIDFGGKP